MSKVDVTAADVRALLGLASQMRRDAALGFVVWGSGRLLGAAETIERAVAGQERPEGPEDKEEKWKC